MKALVYGNWPDRTKNILPFFTASYNEIEKGDIETRKLEGKIKLIFVGALDAGKQPIKSVMVCELLNKNGILCELNLFGDGSERKRLETYIKEKNLGELVHLKGKRSPLEVKSGYVESHFLVFMSKSEGWPKAVAEAMWWGCLPVTLPVSCVPEMLGFGERGELIKDDIQEAVKRIHYLIGNPEMYSDKCKAASDWSRQFTKEKFEAEISGLVA
jgi:glycosyltransferase involved in cell wall biosynthesis